MHELAAQIAWRGEVSDEELLELTESHGGVAVRGWWTRVRAHSLGWVVARSPDGVLVGFVNVAWDGGDHAFLIDTKTRPSHQRRGLGRAVVQRAVEGARAAGCEWLFVDFESRLAAFYLDACGFESTAAGLIRLRPVPPDPMPSARSSATPSDGGGPDHGLSVLPHHGLAEAALDAG